MQLAADAAVHAPTGAYHAPEALAYDVATAARIMGVSKATVFNELKKGAIAAKKFGRKTLITRAAIDVWVANLPARNAA